MQSNGSRRKGTSAVRFLFGTVLNLFSFFLFFNGCALQSSLVDLEQEVGKTQKMQEELLLLREQLDKRTQAFSEKMPADRSKGMAELLGEINRLKEQLQYLEGRIEKGERKISESFQKVDDQAYQTDALTVRVDLLEQKVFSVQNKDGSNTPLEMGSQSGKTLSPTEAYNLAYNDYLKGNYDLAIISFQNYINQYPRSTFVPEAIYWIGQSHYNQGSYQDAVRFFEQIEEKYPQHEKAPNALLKAAFSFVELSKPDRAKELLLKVIDQFPQSNEAYRAKDKLSSLSP